MTKHGTGIARTHAPGYRGETPTENAARLERELAAITEPRRDGGGNVTQTVEERRDGFRKGWLYARRIDAERTGEPLTGPLL